MIALEKVLAIGAALAVAEVMDHRVDSWGNGEIELAGNGMEFTFSVDSECKISLWRYSGYEEGDGLPFVDEVEELNRDIAWDSILDGALYDKIHEAWQNAAEGPFYDFYLQEYVSENAA